MKYHAFISYSHKDLPAVRKLHRKIETFLIPRMLRRLSRTAPKRIYPIFRDETDLAGVTLTPKIEEALEVSDFLIVICTPNSADSVWVNREITAFLRTHSPERIIPVFLDRKTQREFEQAFPGMLAPLEAARNNGVLWGGHRRKTALFEIVSRLLCCYSPELTERYRSRQENLAVPAAMLLVILLLIPMVDLSRAYQDAHDIREYYTDVSYAYGWPQPAGSLKESELAKVRDYYICTYRGNRIIRIQHISESDSGNALPGSFLLESDIMEFAYNDNWQSSSRVSRVTFRDSSGEILFVKHYALDMGIADLTVAPDSSDPYFLPGDITAGPDAAPAAEASAYSCRLAQHYDEAGRVETIWFLTDSFSYHSCDSNGYFGITYDYDSTGALKAVHFLDLEGNIMDTVSRD